MQEIVHSTALAFVLKAFGALLSFLFNVAIARLLGAEDIGIYFLALSVGMISSVIGRVGLDNALLRFIAAHAAREEWDMVRAVHAIGIKIAIIISGIVMLIIFLSAPWLAELLFNKPELTEPLRWMSLSILPFALLNLKAESLKGLKHIRAAMFVQGIIIPMVALLLIWPLATIWGVSGAIGTYVIAVLIAASVGVWFWWRISKEWPCQGIFPLQELWQSCRHLFVVSLINRALMPWAPLFLLGVWMPSSDVGIFGSSLRLVMIVSFFLVAVNNVVAPKFSEIYAKGEMDILGKVARQTALFITLLASPLLLLMTLWGDWVMSIFGPDFTVGGTALAILAIGQFVSVLCGSVGYLLMMSGNEKTYSQIAIFSAIIQFFLAVILIPVWGLKGAAIATAAAVIIQNLISVYMVQRLLDIQTIPLLRGSANGR